MAPRCTAERPKHTGYIACHSDPSRADRATPPPVPEVDFSPEIGAHRLLGFTEMAAAFSRPFAGDHNFSTWLFHRVLKGDFTLIEALRDL